jgi:RimJ/RimL family protein N-acetyltransferase
MSNELPKPTAEAQAGQSLAASALLCRWRAGVLTALKSDDPWFPTEDAADEWAYKQSCQLHNNDVWAVWDVQSNPVTLYHQSLRYRAA